MNKLVSVDFETAGLFDDAVCLSFGLTMSDYDNKDITFDELVKDGLYIEFDYKEQLTLGRKTQKSVMEWWKEKTTPAARDAAWGMNRKRLSIREFPMQLMTYLAERSVNPKEIDIYDRNCFDASKMQHIMEETLGEKVFWNYQNRYEFATALRFLGSDRYGGIAPDAIPGMIHHHPLHDAALDHLRILKAMHG